MKTILKWVVAVVVLVQLLACSGGGGSTQLPPPAPTFSIGGNLTGLIAGRSITLQNNGHDDLTLAVDGSFIFATPIASGSSYNVTVLTQPVGQTCTVVSGSGTVSNTNVTDVGINCVPNMYTIGGTLSGLGANKSITLQNNGGVNLTLSAGGSFTFATPIASGSSYNVTVLSQPAGQSCSLANSSGTMLATNVTNISVSCVAITWGVGGTVYGLSGAGLVLQNNGADDRPVAVNGSFMFNTPIPEGSSYTVKVKTRPTNPSQLCTIENGEGVISTTVTNIAVRCHTRNQRLAASGDFNCVRMAGGTLKCWGRNDLGQLGQGDTSNRGDNTNEMGTFLLPLNMGTGRSVSQVSTGATHTCAILDNGTVKCWGNNGQGQLGLGSIGGGAMGDQPGEMGDSLPIVSLGSGRTAIQISAGDTHSCAILDNHALKCWGNNSYGELGLGDTLGRASPAQMGDALPAVNLGTGRYAVQVVASVWRTCAVLDNGSLKCWGYNATGLLGLGDTNNRGDQTGEMGDNLPSISLGTGRTVLEVAVSRYHACALLDNGTVKCWGDNTFGQLGAGDTLTRGTQASQMGDNLPITNLGSNVVAAQIMVGDVHSCARLSSGTVKCWGNGLSGQLGQENTNALGWSGGQMGDALPSVNLGTGRQVVEVSNTGLKPGHNCAVLDNGTVKCWGSNFYGELGLGDTVKRGDNSGEMGDLLPEVNLGGPL